MAALLLRQGRRAVPAGRRHVLRGATVGHGRGGVPGYRSQPGLRQDPRVHPRQGDRHKGNLKLPDATAEAGAGQRAGGADGARGCRADHRSRHAERCAPAAHGAAAGYAGNATGYAGTATGHARNDGAAAARVSVRSSALSAATPRSVRRRTGRRAAEPLRSAAAAAAAGWVRGWRLWGRARGPSRLWRHGRGGGSVRRCARGGGPAAEHLRRCPDAGPTRSARDGSESNMATAAVADGADSR